MRLATLDLKILRNMRIGTRVRLKKSSNFYDQVVRRRGPVGRIIAGGHVPNKHWAWVNWGGYKNTYPIADLIIDLSEYLKAIE